MVVAFSSMDKYGRMGTMIAKFSISIETAA